MIIIIIRYIILIYLYLHNITTIKVIEFECVYSFVAISYSIHHITHFDKTYSNKTNNWKFDSQLFTNITQCDNENCIKDVISQPLGIRGSFIKWVLIIMELCNFFGNSLRVISMHLITWNENFTTRFQKKRHLLARTQNELFFSKINFIFWSISIFTM